MQMDRSWINSRLFSKPHLDGVDEFMKFVSERFEENEGILCPCRKCLNQVHRHKGLVEDHLYINGMSSTYKRWILHGEPPDGRINENADHMDEHIGFTENANENIGMDEEEEQDDDRLLDMLEELYTAEQQDGGGGRESMFAKNIRRDEEGTLPWCSLFKIFICGEVTSYQVILPNKQCCIHCYIEAVIISILGLLSSNYIP